MSSAGCSSKHADGEPCPNGACFLAPSKRVSSLFIQSKLLDLDTGGLSVGGNFYVCVCGGGGCVQREDENGEKKERKEKMDIKMEGNKEERRKERGGEGMEEAEGENEGWGVQTILLPFLLCSHLILVGSSLLPSYLTCLCSFRTSQEGIWSETRWCTPVLPALWKQRQGCHYEVKASLFYIVSSKPYRAT